MQLDNDLCAYGEVLVGCITTRILYSSGSDYSIRECDCSIREYQSILLLFLSEA